MFRHLLASSILALVAPVVSLTASAPLNAQSGPPVARPSPVTVALVEELPKLNQQYAAVILRVAEPQPRDVILLPRATASGALLDAAVRTLLHSRALQGERATMYKGKPFHVLTLGVRMNAAPEAWAQREVPLAQRVVDRLRSAETPMQRMIPGVGTAAALDFIPPSLARVAGTRFTGDTARQ